MWGAQGAFAGMKTQTCPDTNLCKPTSFRSVQAACLALTSALTSAFTPCFFKKNLLAQL